MGFFGLSGAAFFFAWTWRHTFRDAGGWQEVRASRSAPPDDPRFVTWQRMPTLVRSLYFTLPISLVVGVLSLICGAIVYLKR